MDCTLPRRTFPRYSGCRMNRCAIGVWTFSLLVPQASAQSPGAPTLDAIEQRLDALDALPTAQREVAAGALDQARRAVARAREMAIPEGTAERARQIAWAACILAERQIALEQTQLSILEATAAAEQARVRLESAEQTRDTARARHGIPAGSQ